MCFGFGSFPLDNEHPQKYGVASQTVVVCFDSCWLTFDPTSSAAGLIVLRLGRAQNMAPHVDELHNFACSLNETTGLGRGHLGGVGGVLEWEWRCGYGGPQVGLN